MTLTDYIIVESRIIRNRKFAGMLSKAGLEGVHLEEDSGTVYVMDDEGVASTHMSDCAWYATRYKDQSPEQWVLDVALKYLEEVDGDELEASKTIHPNFDYLYELCGQVKEGDYYKKKLGEYKK